eukprot:364088-Rhodomonas_salina.4
MRVASEGGIGAVLMSMNAHESDHKVHTVFAFPASQHTVSGTPFVMRWPVLMRAVLQPGARPRLRGAGQYRCAMRLGASASRWY